MEKDLKEIIKEAILEALVEFTNGGVAKNRGNPKVDHIKQLCDPYSKHYNEQKAA